MSNSSSRKTRRLLCEDCGAIVLPYIPKDIEVRGIALCHECDELRSKAEITQILAAQKRGVEAERTRILELMGEDDITPARSGGYRKYVRVIRNQLRQQLREAIGGGE